MTANSPHRHLPLIPNAAWREHAYCRTHYTPDMWFAGKGENEQTKHAKHLCKTRCPVVAECLEAALTSPVAECGVWGGLTELERRPLRRKPLPTIRHGTEAGEAMHRRIYNEVPCAACREAARRACRLRRDRQRQQQGGVA